MWDRERQPQQQQQLLLLDLVEDRQQLPVLAEDPRPWAPLALLLWLRIVADKAIAAAAAVVAAAVLVAALPLVVVIAVPCEPGVLHLLMDHRNGP